ncbi:hypothetical protein [Parasedimentitalea denitrificans]|nr:hypothetical protein [Sedimentitalea sp. CY04]
MAAHEGAKQTVKYYLSWCAAGIAFVLPFFVAWEHLGIVVVVAIMLYAVSSILGRTLFYYGLLAAVILALIVGLGVLPFANYVLPKTLIRYAVESNASVMLWTPWLVLVSLVGGTFGFQAGREHQIRQGKFKGK